MEPVSGSKMQFSVLRDLSKAEETRDTGHIPDRRDQRPSLAHRCAGIPQEPVLPTVSAPFTTNPAKGIEYLESIPRSQLARLLVDGELLNREKGVGRYERREPRCLETLSEGWGVILGWLKSLKPGEAPVITSENLCELHKVVAAHHSGFSPGEFVKADARCIKLPISHSEYSDMVYFDSEGLSEAEVIYEQQIAQSSLTDNQALKKAAFIVAYTDKQIKLPLFLGKNVAAELSRNIRNPEAVRDILIVHKQNVHEASYPKVQQFYSIMAEHLTTARKSYFACWSSGDKEGKVLDEITQCLTQDFSHYQNCRKTPYF